MFAYNSRINLTGLDKRERAWRELIAPALGFYHYTRDAESIADIGSGNGIPGVVIAILNRQAKVTLIESRKNRVAFMREVKYNLGLDYEVISGRAETVADKKFSCAVGFRVAELEVFLQLSARMLLDDGVAVQYCPQLPPGEKIKVVDKSGDIWYYQKHADGFIVARKCFT